jgi:glutaredoxin
MIEVALYTKDECSLCEKAKEVILAVRREIHFDYREVDITGDEETYQEFREQIPIIFVNGRKAFKFHVTAPALAARLRRELSRSD